MLFRSTTGGRGLGLELYSSAQSGRTEFHDTSSVCRAQCSRVWPGARRGHQRPDGVCEPRPHIQPARTLQDRNQAVYAVANALGDDLRGRLVFVGGCTTALFITDEITLEGVRATDDVDLIVDLVGRAQWAQLQEQLRQKGFAESPEDDVICRMRLGDLKVDFMPDDKSILGFSNRWYAKGIERQSIIL